MRIRVSLRRAPPYGQGREQGFSLVELMMVIGIAAIIMAIALPTYSNWRQRHALSTAADALMAHIKQARIMAISDNRCVELKLDVAAPYGYTLDVNGPTPLYVPLSQYSNDLSMTTTIAAANKAFVFRSDGTAGTNTCASFSTAGGSVTILSASGDSRTITVNNVGRAYFQ